MVFYLPQELQRGRKSLPKVERIDYASIAIKD